MSLKYALYPGCAAKGATPELYQSTMAIIGRLGIEVTELTASSCCGAVVVAEADPDGALALIFFFSSRRRHTRCSRDWSSDVCSSDLRGSPSSTPIRWASRGSIHALSSP